jgi:hypothetical protein
MATQENLMLLPWQQHRGQAEFSHVEQDAFPGPLSLATVLDFENLTLR